MIINPLTHEWLTNNFSPQFQYIVRQTGEENRQIYQLEGVILIQLNSLDQFTRYAAHPEGRIANLILGVKGWMTIFITMLGNRVEFEGSSYWWNGFLLTTKLTSFQLSWTYSTNYNLNTRNSRGAIPFLKKRRLVVVSLRIRKQSAKHCSLEVLNWSLWFEPDAGQIRNLWKAVLCGGFGIIDVLIVQK